MRSTLLVRCLMTAHGKGQIFTNKYKTCRTVKCYSYAGEKDAALIKGIKEALTAAGVQHSVKFHDVESYYGSIKSLIVRLPL